MEQTTHTEGCESPDEPALSRRLTTFLTEEEYAEIKSMAKSNLRSMSGMTRTLLVSALEAKNHDVNKEGL
ncbi:hypothetical protein DQY68_25290 [Salmonella enterica subsp. salamae]|nr:hypothetical protein [Salmonella enterica subsp. salamae]